MTEMEIRTVGDDVKEFTQKIDELSDQIRERLTELFAELIEIGSQSQPTTEGMLRQAAILMEQTEIGRRVKLLDYITEAIKQYTEDELGFVEESG